MPVLFVTAERRRSQRIPLAVPLMIESLEPTVFFGGRCTSIDVSLHGCQFYLSHPLKSGTRLRLVIRDATQTINLLGRVVSSREQPHPSIPAWSNARQCRVGVEFTTPGNVWGVQSPPADWVSTPLCLANQ